MQDTGSCFRSCCATPALVINEVTKPARSTTPTTYACLKVDTAELHVGTDVRSMLRPALEKCTRVRVSIGQPRRRCLWDGRLTSQSATESRKRFRQARGQPNQLRQPCPKQPGACRRNADRGTDKQNLFHWYWIALPKRHATHLSFRALLQVARSQSSPCGRASVRWPTLPTYRNELSWAERTAETNVHLLDPSLGRAES
jgi:hypothetical protein